MTEFEDIISNDQLIIEKTDLIKADSGSFLYQKSRKKQDRLNSLVPNVIP